MEAEEESVPDVPRCYDGESITDFNQRLFRYHTQDLQFEFSGVAAMLRDLPYTRGFAKLDPVPRPPGLPRP